MLYCTVCSQVTVLVLKVGILEPRHVRSLRESSSTIVFLYPNTINHNNNSENVTRFNNSFSIEAGMCTDT